MILCTNERQWPDCGTVLALGTFDGVHIGHKSLIRKARSIAEAEKLTCVVYTYSSHPASVFSPERIPPLLETPEEKVRSLALAGAHAAILRPFTREYAALSPEDFIRMLMRTLHPQHIVVGYNYSFGLRGSGKAEDLLRMGDAYGFRAHIMEEVALDGKTVSSTRIREAIAHGDMCDALRCLGRYYSLTGRIVQGRRIGRTIGFETANIPYPSGKVIPGEGVYAGFACLNDAVYPAAINIGSHPTVSGVPGIEAHLLDYPGGDLYGEAMRIGIAGRIREERRFDTLDSLKKQIALDCENTRRMLSAAKRQAPVM